MDWQQVEQSNEELGLTHHRECYVNKRIVVCTQNTQQWMVSNICQPFNEMLYKLISSKWEWVKFWNLSIFFYRLIHLLKRDIELVNWCNLFLYFKLIVMLFGGIVFVWLLCDCDFIKNVEHTHEFNVNVAFIFQKPHLHRPNRYWLAAKGKKIRNFKLIGWWKLNIRWTSNVYWRFAHANISTWNRKQTIIFFSSLFSQITYSRHC